MDKVQINKGCSSLSELVGSMQTWLLNYTSNWNKNSVDSFLARSMQGKELNDFEFKLRFFFDLFEQYKLEHSKAFGKMIVGSVVLDKENTYIPDILINVAINDDDLYVGNVMYYDVIAANNLTATYNWHTFKVETEIHNQSIGIDYENYVGGGFYFNTVDVGLHKLRCSVIDVYGVKQYFKILIQTI